MFCEFSDIFFFSAVMNKITFLVFIFQCFYNIESWSFELLCQKFWKIFLCQTEVSSSVINKKYRSESNSAIYSLVQEFKACDGRDCTYSKRWPCSWSQSFMAKRKNVINSQLEFGRRRVEVNWKKVLWPGETKIDHFRHYVCFKPNTASLKHRGCCFILRWI